jgi:hypothetical protein
MPVTELWKIRPFQSAGSQSALLNSFRSRAHIIISCTFPRSSISFHLTLLQQAYYKAGFKSSQLQPIVNKLLAKHHLLPKPPPTPITSSAPPPSHNLFQLPTYMQFQQPTSTSTSH